ncbi:hypothetical protein [Pararhodobacter sp. SW119]|uniref:hypothetical protein n=1 Tax=Pararhodobacter sp. SW119 TaxID=2780075 RepID=UPI001AE03B19|nr:hypothetical protein [Pararhodobacter sp. SW119]
MDRQFAAELNERLFTHFVAGAWRAPLSDRHLPVTGPDGAPLGRIVCAGPSDIARACGGVAAQLRAAAEAADPAVLWQALRDEGALLAALRAGEGVEEMLRAPEPVDLPGKGPLVLLTAAAVPVDRIAGLLIAGARRGMIWKPAPAAATSAHLMMRILGPRAGGRLAMVQGDHATGALLAGRGGLVWAGQGPAPADLPAPLLSLSARPRARR